MAFINWTESVGIIMANATTTTTGSLFITLLVVLLFILAMALMFGIELEYTAILVLPLMLAYMSHYSDFVAPGFVILLYMAFIITKNWLFK